MTDRALGFPKKRTHTDTVWYLGSSSYADLWEISGGQDASSPFDVGSEGLGGLDKQAGLGSVLFLPQLPECWDDSAQSPLLVSLVSMELRLGPGDLVASEQRWEWIRDCCTRCPEIPPSFLLPYHTGQVGP